MRELKFRAWVKSENCYMGKWLSTQHPTIFSAVNEVAEFYGDDDLVVEQYTGLEDRGVEIYEGDIIRWTNSTGREITAPIVWNTRAWCWTAGDYMLGGLLEFDIEVVGNIHEDLKLLEAKE